MPFDLDVNKYNAKGQIVMKQPYRLVIENGVERFERPPGSGDWFTKGGDSLKIAAPAAPVTIAPEPSKQAKK